MSRGASANVQAELAKAANKPFHLFELYLDGAPTYATDAWRAVDWDGRIYPALGKFLDFDGVEENSDMSIAQARVRLSGVDQALIASVLQHEYIDRRLVIRKAFFDADEAVVVDPLPIHDGRADAPEIHEDPESGKCEVTVASSSQWIDFERKPGRHTNHEEQQLYFPGDLAFEYVAQLNRQIKWGAA